MSKERRKSHSKKRKANDTSLDKESGPTRKRAKTYKMIPNDWWVQLGDEV